MGSLGSCSNLWAVAALLGQIIVVFNAVAPSLAYNLHEGLVRSRAYDTCQQSGCDDSVPAEASREYGSYDSTLVAEDYPTFELLQIDHHPDSPLHKSETSFAEKIQDAVTRSKRRVELVTRIISPYFSTDRGVVFDSNVEIGVRGTSFEEPVSASPGSYIMTISLGTPAQTKTVIVDTGSDLNWVQCAPCTSCYSQPDPVFAPTKSSTYSRMPYSNALCSELPQKSNSGGYCTYRYGYGDQSTTQGDFSFETITLSTTTGSKVRVPNFAFGCGHRNQGTFSGTDGLVGLGQGPISFPSQLGSLFNDKFAYCLVSITSSASTTSPLLFGDAALSTVSNLEYTPLVTNSINPTFYYVKMNDISVGGQALNLPASTFSIKSSGYGGVILDSGTTITQLISAAYTPFLAKLRSLIKYPIVDSSQIGLDLCYDTSQVTNPTFPAITLKFAGVDVDLPAENAFLLVDEQGTVCLAFAGTTDFTIIGNIQQQNYYFLYDIQNKQVGIAPAQCDTLTVFVGAQTE